jgi:[protein-PII] uridylyltransferase
VDELVRTLAEQYFPDTDAIALLAVGGYGRGELAFASDVDLHLLHRGPVDEGAARSFLRAMWDIGWEVGHQVVTVDQAAELAGRNPQTLTAYLEMRTVWGQEALSSQLETRIRARLVAPRLDQYIATKVAELENRHLQAGDTVYLAEPDTKESPGGLRDIHALLWISNASGGARTWVDYLAQEHISAERYAEYQASYDLILRVRNGLHLLKRRTWDRLDHLSQVRLAESLGFEGSNGRLAVEEFMRSYYRAAWQIYTFARVQLARGGWWVDDHGPTILPVLKPRDREPAKWSIEEIKAAPLEVVRRFQQIAETRDVVEPETVSWLTHNAAVLGAAARREAEFGSCLMELVRAPHAAWSLHALHQLGILGALLPEFERLTALVQYDPYHHYTVDEHTLRAVDALEDLLEPDNPERQRYHTPRFLEAIRELPLDHWRPSRVDLGLLRLAILYHDIGKGSGAGIHEERGARLLQRAGRRLGLEESELEDAVFLVRHHLVLNSAAQRRDVREEALLRRIRRLVRTPRRLHLLALLTVCDMTGLSPSFLNAWKCRLLADLVDRVEALMEGAPLPAEEQAREDALAGFPAGVHDRLAEFLDTMPIQYVHSLRKESLISDEALVASFNSAPGDDWAVALLVEHEAETSVITVATRDRARLLARTCGLMAACDLNILHARIFTRTDGVVFDRFIVTDAATAGPMNAEQVESITRDMAAVLENRIDVEQLLEQHRDRWSLRDATRMEHPGQIEFDPTASDRYTVIEIRAQDHVGLLHDVTGIMADLGVAIHQAFITTEGEQAVDAFYVTDPLGAPLDAPTCLLLEARLYEVL